MLCFHTFRIPRLLCICLMISFQIGCLGLGSRPDTNSDVPKQEFNARSLGKSDINMMMDIYVLEIREQLRSLMEKLYMRNPRELGKSSYRTAEENVRQLFSRTSNWYFRDLNDL